MDGDAARELEPSLGATIGWAVRADVDGHVAPESLAAAAVHFRERGGTVREHAAVRGMRRILAGLGA